jgi:UPF0271 protein
MAAKGEASKRRMLILDATAFYAGLPYTSVECYKTTVEVLKEVTHSSKYLAMINTLIDSKRLVVEEPPPEAYQRVRAAAAETKDISSLSEADLSILALALHYSEKGDVAIVTDDYAVQNVAQTLNIQFTPTMSRGIRRMVRWVKYCPACSQVFGGKMHYCPVCGTALKRRVGSSKVVRY